MELPSDHLNMAVGFKEIQKPLSLWWNESQPPPRWNELVSSHVSRQNMPLPYTRGQSESSESGGTWILVVSSARHVAVARPHVTNLEFQIQTNMSNATSRTTDWQNEWRILLGMGRMVRPLGLQDQVLSES